MTSNLPPVAVELRRQYLREWRRRNPDKVRGYNQKYWIKKAEEAMRNAKNEAHS